MARRVNKATERSAGLGGAALVAPWVFQGMLHVVDWIGRAETAMTVMPYLGVFGTPLAFMVELVGGVALLFYATRLEHDREVEEAPLIIRPWSEPENLKRHWFWLKLALVFGGVSLTLAVGAFWFLRAGHPRPKNDLPVVTYVLPADSRTESPSSPIAKSSNPARITQSYTATAPQTKSSKVEATPLISAPDHPVVPKDLDASTAVAIINGQAVRASDKPVGKLLVVLTIGGVSSYKNNVDQAVLDNVASALILTGNLQVITSKQAGYSLAVRGKSYGFSLTAGRSKTIYYLDESLKSACSSLKDIVSKIVGPVECRPQILPVESDSNESNIVNIERDFLKASGIDIEIVL